MKAPDEVFTLFEQWPQDSVPRGVEAPDWVYFARYLGGSSREAIHRYDLKKRGYISTTSMDSELALITANMVLARPGGLFYDPFAGTGSFPVACAHFGGMAWGSDIDGRSMRGQGGKKSLVGNFEQYGLRGCLGGAFVADLTNTPLRRSRLFDGIVCDPPYGVREGLQVLGLKDEARSLDVLEWGKNNYLYEPPTRFHSSHSSRRSIHEHSTNMDHRDPRFVPPKKPYGFQAMLDDILVFATDTLVDNGRVSFWMPTANDDQQEVPIPTHPSLELVSVCVQPFYKCQYSLLPQISSSSQGHKLTIANAGSRRLMTYRRIPDAEVSSIALEAYKTRLKVVTDGESVNELNPFRDSYFKGFRPDE